MPQTSPDSPTLSICVPHNSKPLAILEETIRSAARAMPPNSELLVLPSGSEACKRLKTVELPPGGRVIASEEPLSMVSNWNRCLSESTGDLVHILHDDDVVEAGFYEAIIELHRRFSAAALYSTGFAQLGEDGAAPADGAEPALLRGDDAGRFLLLDERHEPGAVVVTRRVFREMGGFREEFPHSLD
jgi:hypothetical protein